MEDLQTFYQRIQAEGLKIDRTVTHGISCSIYFWDPEDNRIELYYKTGFDVRQPLGEQIDLNQPADEILAFSKSFEVSKGPSVGASADPNLWKAPV
jgi:catechol-2,3-dioxygenase